MILRDGQKSHLVASDNRLPNAYRTTSKWLHWQYNTQQAKRQHVRQKNLGCISEGRRTALLPEQSRFGVYRAGERPREEPGTVVENGVESGKESQVFRGRLPRYKTKIPPLKTLLHATTLLKSTHASCPPIQKHRILSAFESSTVGWSSSLLPRLPDILYFFRNGAADGQLKMISIGF